MKIAILTTIAQIYIDQLNAWNAADPKPNHQPQYTDAAKLFWQGCIPVIQADTTLTDAQKTVLCTKVSEASQRCYTPDDTDIIADQLLTLIETGSWTDLGIPTTILAEPTPETRTTIQTLLQTYITNLYPPQ